MRKLERIHWTKLINYIQAHPAWHSCPYWLAAILTGLGSVLYALGFEFMSELFVEARHSYPWALFLMTPLCFLVGWYLVENIPGAKGSGIPQVKAAINSEAKGLWKGLESLAGLKVAAAKVLSSFFCVLGGGLIGREGPTIQLASSIFYLTGKHSKRYWPSRSPRPWIIAGGAAGLSAAFNTPLGGIVFAIEELAPKHFGQFKTTLITAVIIAGVVAQWIWGPYLYFGSPELLSVGVSILPWSILVAGLSGLSGGIFGRLLIEATERVVKLKQKKRIPIVLGCGVGVAGLALLTDPLFLGGGSEVVRTVLFQPDVEAPWTLLLGRYLGALLSYISGSAGGIFAPALATGACIGNKLNSLLSLEHNSLFVLVGMTAYLTAVTRAPFTAFVLVMEMTNSHDVIFHLMVGAGVGLLVARLVDTRSFYDSMAELYQSRLEKSVSAPNEPPKEMGN